MMIRPMMGRPQAASRALLDPCIYWNEWPDQLFRTAGWVIPRDWDYSERARRVRAPVLIVHGTEDPNAPVEGGRAWAELLPNARLLEIEGVGHAPWLEAPDEFFPQVDGFLRGG
jgi:pimeloyl-ACP methyl ester carboxylesterase